MKDLAKTINSKPSEQELCESCGDGFKCGAKLTGCWCAEVKLTDEIRTELTEKFNNCLCPNCLKKYSETAKQRIA